MHIAIKKKEKLTLVSGGAIAAFLLIPTFHSIPVWGKLVSVVVAGYVLYLTLRLVWIMVDPTDSSASLKPRAAGAQARGLCGVCGKNRQGHNSLEVGYRKPTPRAIHFSIVDTVLIGEGMADGIRLSVPICERCAKRYLFLSRFRIFAPVGLDRSFRVLKKKPGYLRGLRHPFGPLNIRKV